MINEQKQGLRSFSILSLFAIIALSASALTPMWKSEETTRSLQAIHKAEGLAYQIFEGRRSASRGPASVGSMNHLNQEKGEIGQDPWGNHYRFRIFGGESDASRVLVWSAGPNGRQETDEEQVEKNRAASIPQLKGDDVGVVVLIK